MTKEDGNNEQSLDVLAPVLYANAVDIPDGATTSNTTAVVLLLGDTRGKVGFFFVDECAFYQVPTKKKKLAKRGKTPVIKSKGGRKHKSVIGVLSLFAATVLTMFMERCTGQAFIGFLKALMGRYKHLQKIYLVIDNAPSHHAKIVHKFLELVKYRLEVIFLPPYSPELNPIEKFWKYVREWVTHDQFHPSFDNLVLHLRGFLEKQKKPTAEVLSRCCYY